MRATDLSFDTTGESNETLVHTDREAHPDAFIRLENGAYTALTVRDGVPVASGTSEYLTSVDLNDLLDTLSRRGYRVDGR